jgi:hypothetical protein
MASTAGRLGAGALVTAFALTLGIPAAPAQVPSAFVANASANGVRVQYTVPAFLVLERFVDGGGPIAQAEMASGEVARAFASNPYPGDTAVGLPGIVAFGTGLPAPPDYPLYVSADYPFKPEQSAGDASGTFRLTAKAGTKETTAVAAAGPDASGAVSRAVTTVADDGTVTAVAETVTKGISAGEGVLEIAAVTSRSVTTLEPGATKPKTVTDLSVDGASIAGTPVSITPQGLRIGTSGIPLAAAEQLAPINAALQQSGLTVRVVEGADIEGGGSSDVVEITHVGAVPVPGSPTGTFIYRFGGATSSITVGEGAFVAPIVQGAFDSGDQQDALATAPSDLGLPAADVPGLSNASLPRLAVTPASDVAQVIVPRDLRKTIRFFYTVIMVGGALLGLALALWRSKGVHVPWTTSSPG